MSKIVVVPERNFEDYCNDLNIVNTEAEKTEAIRKLFRAGYNSVVVGTIEKTVFNTEVRSGKLSGLTREEFQDTTRPAAKKKTTKKVS